MESATFRDHDTSGGRKTEITLGGSRQILDPQDVRRACEELGLDASQLPGPKGRV